MRVNQGADRVALVGEHYTFKIAKANPRQFAKSVHRHLGRGGVRELTHFWRISDTEAPGTLKYQLLHGIDANRREGRLAQGAHDIVAPTRSLLGGIVNIQPTLQAPDISTSDIMWSFADVLDGNAVPKIGHVLETPQNFGIDGNAVKFVDGAGSGLAEVVATYEVEVRQALGSIATKAGLA